MIKPSETVKSISLAIAVKSIREAEYHPIDRAFLSPYIEDILQLDPIEFVFYNIERVSPTYTNYLFVCLPELWLDISVDDLLSMMNSFSNEFSYFILIEFTYKYLEIDLLQIIIEHSKKSGFFEDAKKYLQRQWNVIVKSEDERLELEEGIEKEYFQYNVNDWIYIKQKLLLDERAKPALMDYDGLESYIMSLIDRDT